MRPLFATRRQRLLARVGLYGTALLVGLPLAASQVLLGTTRQPVHAPRPPWEETAVASEGLRLRAWLARDGETRAAAVLVHGLGDSLESYAGSGATLLRRGHPVLLLDLRAHGGSEGRLTTLGGREREDVRAALAALRERGLGRRGFVLFGVSMGAVAVLRAAAEEADVRGRPPDARARRAPGARRPPRPEAALDGAGGAPLGRHVRAGLLGHGARIPRSERALNR